MILFRWSKKMGFWVFLVHPTVVLVLLSASVERCFVSRMRDFFLNVSLLDVRGWSHTKSKMSSETKILTRLSKGTLREGGGSGDQNLLGIVCRGVKVKWINILNGKEYTGRSLKMENPLTITLMCYMYHLLSGSCFDWTEARVFTNSATLALGRVGHRVAMSGCVWFWAIGCSFFLGLSLALRSHDQFQVKPMFDRGLVEPIGKSRHWVRIGSSQTNSNLANW